VSGDHSAKGKVKGMKGAHPRILTTRVLRPFQRVTVDVGKNGGGVHGIIPDIGSGGALVHDIMMDSRSDSISILCEFLLEPES